MKRLLSGAIAIGMVGSATFLGEGVAQGETALIVPGASEPVGPMKALYHFNPAERPQIGANYYDSANADKKIIPYPGSMWPITGLDAPTVGESVVVGTDNLDKAIRTTEGPMVVSSLSMGTLALDAEQARLATDPNAPPADQLTFIKVSDPTTVLQRAFKPGTHVPIIDYTVRPPVESQYNTIQVVSEYDVYADPPDRKNPLAYINGVLGQNHSQVAFSNPAELPPPIVTTNSRGATTTTYFIPAKELPLTTQLREWGVPNPVADRLEPVMRPMVDNAYVRNDDPASPPPQQPRPAVPVNLQNLNLPTLPTLNVPSLNVPAVGPGPALAPANPVNLLNAGRVLGKILPGGKKR